MQDYTKNPAVKAALLIAAVAVMLAFFYGYDVSRMTRLSNAIQNTGHIPFFGILSLIFLALSRMFVQRWPNPSLLHYIFAFLLSTALGVALEVSQIGTERNADVMDLVRNLAGTGVFLGLRLSWDAASIESLPIYLPGRRFITPGRLRLACIALVILCISPLGFLVWAQKSRNDAFPSIANYNAHWGWFFLEHSGASVSPSEPPPEWTEAKGREVLKMRTRSSHYPRIKIEEPYPDWTGYQFLTFCVYSVEPEPFPIDIKIHDYERRDEYTDRFTREFVIQPGLNKLRLPLEEVKKGPEGREMNMNDIESVTLLLDHPKVSRTFFIDGFELEK